MILEFNKDEFHVVYITECISLTSYYVMSAEVYTQAKMSSHHTISLLQHCYVITLLLLEIVYVVWCVIIFNPLLQVCDIYTPHASTPLL